MANAPSRRLAAAVARATRTGDPEIIGEARRDFITERLAELIEEHVRRAPPLHEDQLARLRRLLAPANEGAA
jgi:hypothetical protein